MGENRKIAKNSLILYGRLLVSTLIGLYTSRIVLQELGVADFGIYAVVGSIITLLNFISTSMLATTLRFIALELGKEDKGDANNAFNTSLIIHISLAVIALFIGEIVGSFYIINYLNIENSKIDDALYVLHFSIIAACSSIVSIPFQGLITAKEDFFASAWINIIQSVLRFVVAILLIYLTENKLRVYAVGTTIALAFSSFQFYYFCKTKYPQVIKWKLSKKYSHYRKILNYNFWILLGTLAFVGRSQGTALLLNSFFGTALNASYGIANQLNGFIMNFAKNLNGAAVPQITKSYSKGDHSRSMAIVYSISKYSFFLMLIPTIPIIISIDEILNIWLNEVPPFTKEFVIIMLLNGLLGSLSSGFDAAIQATGRIRNYQVTVSLLLLLSLSISYLLFWFDSEPYSINIVFLAASFLAIFVGIRFMSNLTEFSVSEYLKKTVLKAFSVVLTITPIFFLRSFFSNSLPSVILFSILTVCSILCSIYYIGLEKDERKVALNFFQAFLSKLNLGNR
ncbi:MAG: oligosaccharide flippase family protein [Ignavibacteria bacterium]|nr:oligosaccharide flippase family protein [Ignavibacteria bacterium]